MSDSFKVAVRGGALGAAEAREVADALAAGTGRGVEIVPLESGGDALRAALRAGECDAIVHSADTLPGDGGEGLIVAAVLAREDARDVAVTRDGTPLHDLPIGAAVGADSGRRAAQARIRNPRAEVTEADGDIEAQLQQVADGAVDAVILAVADLNRLAPDPRGLAYEPLGLAEWPTTPGQGALAVETRVDAAAPLRDALAALDHVPTRLAVAAERTVDAELPIDPAVPLAVHAVLEAELLRVRAIVYAPDGSSRVGADLTHPVGETETRDAGYIRSQGSGNGADAADGDHPIARAAQAGSEVVHRLLERGAAELAPRESPR